MAAITTTPVVAQLEQIKDWCLKGGVNPERIRCIDLSQCESARDFLEPLVDKVYRCASLTFSDIRLQSEGAETSFTLGSPTLTLSKSLLQQRGVDAFRDQVFDKDLEKLVDFMSKPDNSTCNFSGDDADSRDGIAGFGKEILCSSRKVDELYFLYGGSLGHAFINGEFEEKVVLSQPDNPDLRWTPKDWNCFQRGGEGDVKFVAFVGAEATSIPIC